MVVVDQVEEAVTAAVVAAAEGEVVVDPVVDLHVLENLSVHKISATNVEVNILPFSDSQLHIIFSFLDRGHYAYDCEIRLRRQRRMR